MAAWTPAGRGRACPSRAASGPYWGCWLWARGYLLAAGRQALQQGRLDEARQAFFLALWVSEAPETLEALLPLC
ncbi:MAG: hypothetical protein N2313_08550 [Meiothermus ruber]|nr:hypothetical protein [Meiothermus ruber]